MAAVEMEFRQKIRFTPASNHVHLRCIRNRCVEDKHKMKKVGIIITLFNQLSRATEFNLENLKKASCSRKKCDNIYLQSCIYFTRNSNFLLKSVFLGGN